MCLLKRVMPFALTLAIGIAAASLFNRATTNKSELSQPDAEQTIPHSKTWLRIHSQPPPDFPKEAYEFDGYFSVRLYVRLDASGNVTDVTPAPTTLPANCVDAAISAARRIQFSPAMEDDKPISTIALIEYNFSGEYAMVIDNKTGLRHCLHSQYPSSLQMKIISVEGARDPEGWRVIYE